MTISQTSMTSRLSEVDRARQRLREAQQLLATVRLCGEYSYDLPSRQRAEEDVLSALSWVWDAQERASPPVLLIASSLFDGDLEAMKRVLGQNNRVLIAA